MAQSFTLAALGVQRQPAGARDLRGRPRRRHHHRVRQPGPARVRRRDGADENMNNAVSLNSALMTSSRVVGPALAGLLVATVGFGWCFLARRPVVHRRARRAVDDAHRGAAPAPSRRQRGRARSAKACATPGTRARAVDAARDDGGRRHAVVQLPDRVPAVHDPRPARQRDHVHDPVLGRQRRRAHRRARASRGARRSACAPWPWRDLATASRMALMAVAPNEAVGVRARPPARRHEHRVPHRVDRDRADRSRAGDAGPGARAASDAVPRQHADRRPDRRLGVAGSSARATAWDSARSPRSSPGRGGCCAPDGWPRSHSIPDERGRGNGNRCCVRAHERRTLTG